MIYFESLVEQLKKISNSVEVLEVLQNYNIYHLQPLTKIDNTILISNLIIKIQNV